MSWVVSVNGVNVCFFNHGVSRLSGWRLETLEDVVVFINIAREHLLDVVSVEVGIVAGDWVDRVVRSHSRMMRDPSSLPFLVFL